MTGPIAVTGRTAVTGGNQQVGFAEGVTRLHMSLVGLRFANPTCKLRGYGLEVRRTAGTATIHRTGH